MCSHAHPSAKLTFCVAWARQVRERHTKLEEFAGWLACLRRVQAQEGQRQQHQETALALWDMYLAYGGKPLPDQQDKFDEMKEDAAVFQKVHPLVFPHHNSDQLTVTAVVQEHSDWATKTRSCVHMSAVQCHVTQGRIVMCHWTVAKCHGHQVLKQRNMHAKHCWCGNQVSDEVPAANKLSVHVLCSNQAT